jgi:hypothetical protein
MRGSPEIRRQGAPEVPFFPVPAAHSHLRDSLPVFNFSNFLLLVTKFWWIQLL